MAKMELLINLVVSFHAVLVVFRMSITLSFAELYILYTPISDRANVFYVLVSPMWKIYKMIF